MLDDDKYEEWYCQNEDRLYIKFAEQGLDREMDFDLESELDKEYQHYIHMQQGEEEDTLNK